MEHERDEYLMARVGRDQPELLEKLLRRYASPLLTFIQRMVGDHHRGEELFQEVFLAVWIKRRQYQYPRPFKPWLYAHRAEQVPRLVSPSWLSATAAGHGGRPNAGRLTGRRRHRHGNGGPGQSRRHATAAPATRRRRAAYLGRVVVRADR